MAQDDAALATLAGGVGGVPAYGTPEEAVRALAHAANYAAWRRTGTEPHEPPAGIAPDRAAATIAQVLAEGGGWLVPDRVAELLEAYGIPQVRATVAATPAAVARCAAEVGGEVAIKAIAPGLLHKSDAGGVRLGVSGAAAAGRAAREIAAAVRSAGHQSVGFLVQAMAPEGVEMLVGVTSDPDWGPVVACAAGGTAVELLGDVQSRLAPLSRRDASEMLRALRTFPLLDGYRGAPRAAVDALEDIVVRVSALAAAHPEIAELDCNPVLVGDRRRDGGRRARSDRRAAPATALSVAGPLRQLADLARDLEVFARRHDHRGDTGVVRADLTVRPDPGVAAGVERHAKKPEALGGGGADLRRVLAHSAGEDQGVEPVHGGGHSGDAGPEAVHVDGERRAGVRVAGRLAGEQVTHVAGSGQGREAGAVLERIGELGDPHAAALEEP